MGEYTVKRKPSGASSVGRRGGGVSVGDSRRLVRPPVQWLVVSPVLLVASPIAVVISRASTEGFVFAFLLSCGATVAAVLATFVDQLRMSQPSYSAMSGFRLMCAICYVVSLILTIGYIGMVAYRAAI